MGQSRFSNFDYRIGTDIELSLYANCQTIKPRLYLECLPVAYGGFYGIIRFRIVSLECLWLSVAESIKSTRERIYVNGVEAFIGGPWRICLRPQLFQMMLFLDSFVAVHQSVTFAV